MGIFSAFYNPRKPKGFSYEPLYFDAEKEAAEKRRARIIQDAKREKGIETEEEFIPNIRGQFRAKKEKRSQFKNRQNVRVILVFFVLLYLAYLLYQHL